MSEKGRTAYITGGASGIGKAIAEMLVSKGARVFLADINTEGAEGVAAELNKSDPHNAQSTNVDVGDWNSQAKAFGQAVHAFGRIDYVYPIVSFPVHSDHMSGSVGFPPHESLCQGAFR